MLLSDGRKLFFSILMFVLPGLLSSSASAAVLVWDTGVWGDTWDLDTDLDGTTDSVDTDDDNDTVLDVSDAFPLDVAESLDTDTDGTGNNADWDDDGDGVPDVVDADPLDAGNANEITLPLDSTYKGRSLRSGSTVE